MGGDGRRWLPRTYATAVQARGRAGAGAASRRRGDRGARRAARPRRRADAGGRRRRRPRHLRRRAAPGDGGAPGPSATASSSPWRAGARAGHARARHLPGHADTERRPRRHAACSTCRTARPATTTATRPGRSATTRCGSSRARWPPGRPAPSAVAVKSHHHQGIERAGRGLRRHRLVGRATTWSRRSSCRASDSCSGCCGIPEEDEPSRVIAALVDAAQGKVGAA